VSLAQVLGHAWFDGVQADALLHKQVPPPWSPLGPLPPTAAPFTAIATGQATIGQATDLYLVPDTFIEEHIVRAASPNAQPRPDGLPPRASNSPSPTRAARPHTLPSPRRVVWRAPACAAQLASANPFEGWGAHVRLT
jgi:hypothetical protein